MDILAGYSTPYLAAQWPNEDMSKVSCEIEDCEEAILWAESSRDLEKRLNQVRSDLDSLRTNKHYKKLPVRLKDEKG